MKFIDKTNPEYKMNKARSDLIYTQPFFGILALRLELVPTDQVDVMGTNGRAIFYNPPVIRELPQPMVLGVIAHEILHCAFQHMFRRRHRNMDRWNRATDYVINDILLKEAFSLPKERLYNSKYNNLSAEEIYEKLPPKPPDNGAGSAGSGWNFGASTDPALPDPNGKTDSASASKALSKDWEIATKQASHLAKSQGKLPGNLESLVEELLQPQIPWREQIWRFFSQRKPDRVNWGRPNRRLIAQGIYLPSKRFVPTGDIVIANDTSCSVSEDELRIYGSEVSEIHKALKPNKMWILDIDTQIHNIQELGPYDEVELKYYGRGGTSFHPLFQWIEDNNINPDAVVYLTDGYATFPTNAPNYPVMWAITNHDIKPPWGEHLILDI
jgi:predicted metal-dependent peptidase